MRRNLLQSYTGSNKRIKKRACVKRRVRNWKMKSRSILTISRTWTEPSTKQKRRPKERRNFGTPNPSWRMKNKWNWMSFEKSMQRRLMRWLLSVTKIKNWKKLFRNWNRFTLQVQGMPAEIAQWHDWPLKSVSKIMNKCPLSKIFDKTQGWWERQMKNCQRITQSHCSN